METERFSRHIYFYLFGCAGASLQRAGSSVAARSWPGIQPGPPALESAESQPLDHQGGARNRMFLLWSTAWNWEITYLHCLEMPGGKLPLVQGWCAGVAECSLGKWGGWRLSPSFSSSARASFHRGPRCWPCALDTDVFARWAIGGLKAEMGTFKMKRIQLILDPESKSICSSLR